MYIAVRIPIGTVMIIAPKVVKKVPIINGNAPYDSFSTGFQLVPVKKSQKDTSLKEPEACWKKKKIWKNTTIIEKVADKNKIGLIIFSVKDFSVLSSKSIIEDGLFLILLIVDALIVFTICF